MKTESDKDRLYDFDIPIENNRKDEDKPKWGGKTNQTTLDFVNNRYVVLKDFIPKEIINMTMDTWRCIENDEEQYNAIFRPEDELTHSTPEEQRNKSHGAYNFPPAVGIHRYLKNKLDSVIDLNLQETYSYSRKYVRGASLSAHTDRPSCEISLTFPLAYNTDDNTPWKIWLNNEYNWVNHNDRRGQKFIKKNTQDVKPQRGISVDLEVGDVLLYQGPNIPHWRNTLMGDYSYHMFIHFFNQRSKMTRMPNFEYQDGNTPNSRKFVLDWDGNKNRWSKERVEGKGDLQKWTEDVYERVANDNELYVYVNNYAYLTGKVDEDLI